MKHIIAIDPGIVDTGMIAITYDEVTEEIIIDASGTIKENELVDLQNVLQYEDKYDGSIDALVVEFPFAGVNKKSYGKTCEVVGIFRALIGLNHPVIYTSPSAGNKCIGLSKASTHDIAKENYAKENNLPLDTSHEVSAYAALLAAKPALKELFRSKESNNES